MSTLTLSAFDTQLEQTNQQLEALQQKVAETKAIRKAIALKKRLAQKAFTKLNQAIEGINAVVEQLGADGAELQKAAITAVSEYLPVTTTGVEQAEETSAFPPVKADPEVSAKLVSFSRKKNDSNELFTWQPTANNQVSNYFNVARGTIQATYIGSNNKSRLQTVGNKLTEYLEGISFEVRKAQRLEYKYELKIRGIDDDTLGWLTQFDFNQSFTAQLFKDLGDCPEESLQGQSVPMILRLRFEASLIPSDYRLEPNNWIASVGAVVFDRSTGERFYLQSIDPDWVMAKVKAENKKIKKIYLDLFQLDREFADSASSLLRALLACRTQKELEAVKASDLVEEDMVKWVYAHLTTEQKKKLHSICKKQKKAA